MSGSGILGDVAATRPARIKTMVRGIFKRLVMKVMATNRIRRLRTKSNWFISSAI